MKKTFSINIGGFVFNIDDDAYLILVEYIDKLNFRYKSTESGKEIVIDIESRIAELLNLKLKGRQVVSLEDINEIIVQLGTPEDFEDYEEIEKDIKPKTEKIVFRDPNNRIIGGVCGGLSNYLGINANIIRIIFLISFLIYGSGTLIYIILWIVLPEAKTTSQKLIMKGEKITVQNIEKSIKQEFKSVKTNFINWKNSPSNNSGHKFIDFIAALLKVCFKVFVILFGLNLILTGLFFTFLIIVAPWLSNTIITHNYLTADGINFLDLATIFTSRSNVILAYIGLILSGVIPMFALIYMGIKLILKIEHRSKVLNISMLSLWLVGILISLISVVKILDNYKANETFEESNSIELNSDTIYIKVDSKENQFVDFKNLDKIDMEKVLMLAKDGLQQIYIQPKLNIKKSNGDKIELVYTYKSRGNTRKNALEYCKNIEYIFNQDDSLFIFSPFYTYKENSKWHGEMLNITLFVPENKFVFLDRSSVNIIFDIENTINMWDGDMVDKMWKMTEKGFTLVDKDSVFLNSKSNKNLDSVLNDMKDELKKM